MSSDLVSLQHGIVKTSKNKENAGYTVLLMGSTDVGRSSFMSIITTALLGKSIGTTLFVRSPHLHEITSKNGVLVSANILNAVCRRDFF
jgi:GTP-binding protein EngB required for normal cell division